jgi:4-hydroxy-4-methyl-2-oxoglutarate aldolase
VIADSPVLTIRQDFARPARSLIARFGGVAAVHIVDAMDGRGALEYRIKPLDPNAASFAGPALTCHAGADDNLAILGAFAIAQPGDVVIAACEGFTGTAVVGDLFAGMARNCQVAAIVTDGLARDTTGIIATGLPVFVAGVTPNSSSKSGPGTVGLPIVIGNVLISPGDVVVGDRDGVVVVPQADVEAVLARLESVHTAESSFETAVMAGLRIPDFVQELLSSDQVHYVDSPRPVT